MPKTARPKTELSEEAREARSKNLRGYWAGMTPLERRRVAQERIRERWHGTATKPKRGKKARRPKR